MKLNVTNRFIEQNSKLPFHIQFKVLEILKEIQESESINNVNSDILVGFPHIHKIKIDNLSLCFDFYGIEVEVLGIVDAGKELTLIL